MVQRAVGDSAARQETFRVANDKVRGIFSQAFTKFNAIVERNKANIPEIHIGEMLASNELLAMNLASQKHTLNDFIKKRQEVEPSDSTRKKSVVEGIVDTLTTSHEDLPKGAFARDPDSSTELDSLTPQVISEPKLEAVGKNDHWFNLLEKKPYQGSVDVTDLSPLYQARKDTSDKKSLLFAIAGGLETRHLALIKGHLISL